MTPRTRIALLAVALAGVAAILVTIAIVRRGSHAPSTQPAAPHRLPLVPAGQVTLTGTVRDAEVHAIAGVEVVFRRDGRDAIATTTSDGTYRITLPAGTYRVAVRGDRVLSVALADPPRLPMLPSRELAGVPDEALMLRLDATTDLDGVDLEVVATWKIAGRVLDPDARPLAGAVVRAVAVDLPLRPVLGTDTGISGPDGRFELRVAPGAYAFTATHDDYAGVRDTDQETVNGAVEYTLFMTAGCIISGRVVDERGEPAPDGALEQQLGFTDRDFDPSGRIEPDGTFRWATVIAQEVRLRAWPWRSPPSPAQDFACTDGKRFRDVVFQLPIATADLEGLVVDAAGERVPFAYLDVSPLDLGGIGQQERADAEGRWQVHRVPAGRYSIRTHAPGRGVVEKVVRAPDRRAKLTLGGVGRLVGTTTKLENGSFTVKRMICEDSVQRGVSRTLDRRLVVVRGGRFEIDDLPACTLIADVAWRDQSAELRIVIPAGGTASAEVPL